MIVNTFKRSICVLLAVISLSLCMSVPAFSADGINEEAYLDKVMLLEKLGIVTADDTMQYSEETVTRENFAYMLGVFCDISRSKDVLSDGKGMFSDVNAKNPSCFLIESVVDAGFMEGYEDRKFRPTANLTVGQAVKSMLVLLGYDALIAAKGNNQTAYTRQAYELDLLDNVKTPYSGAIKKGELVNMICVALDTEILQISTISSSKSYNTVKNETLLSEYLGVYKIEGVLQATDITGIGRTENTRKGYIVVNGNTIKTDEDMNMYLGKNLNVYCVKDNFNELNMIHFYGKENKNRELIVNAEDVGGLSGTTFSYDENGKTKKIKLTNDATVIFNGKNNPIYSPQMFKINDGTIRFIDANCDGKYETVFIKSYISVWVGQVYNDNGNVFIIDKNDTTKKYTFDINDANNTVNLIKNNLSATVDDIKVNNVVLIAADKMNLASKTILPEASYYEVLISDTKVEGLLESIGSGKKAKLTIDGEEYSMAKSFSLSTYNLSAGNSAKFYLDAFNKIVAAEKIESNVIYGILNGVASDDFPKLVKAIRIFSADGSFKIYELSSKITIDGKRYQKEDVANIETALKAGKTAFFGTSDLSVISQTNAGDYFQLVKYSLNSDGQINMIDTLNNPSYETGENKLKYSNKFEPGTTYFGKAYATTILGGYVYDSNLKIFAVPSDKDNLEAYSIKNDMLSLGYEKLASDVTAYAFDVDEFKYVPIIITEKEIASIVSNTESNNMMIFESLSQKLASDGEAYYTMNGTSVKSGAKVEAFLTDEAYTQYKNLRIESGDIIRWIYNDLNLVATLELLLDNEGNTSKLKYSGSEVNDSAFYSDFRITCGTVEKYNDKFVLFNLGTKTDSSLRNPSAKVLVYDSNTQTTTVGDYSKIKTNEAFPGEASLIFTLQTYSAINSLVVFN